MTSVEILEKRVENCLEMFNKFEENTWGREYWGGVLAHNLKNLVEIEELNGNSNGERNEFRNLH